MTNQLEAMISSEIADFFAGVVEIHTELGGPNTVEEAQWQLTERVTRIASECEAALIAALEQSQQQITSLFERVSGEPITNYPPDTINWLADIIEGQLDASEGALVNAKKSIAELEASHYQVIQARDHYKSLVSASQLAVKPIEKISPSGAKEKAFWLGAVIDDDEADAFADGWNECVKAINAGITVQGVE